ncbi:MBOAT family protein [Chromobacterium phragmitis]|uniref:Probable alginate O-acetylase AlgI n=1 Tax=Chromobacterium phragmitis TaxID=2202141 RepID=A0A344UKJ7_9NEIS|nr:MBOAT family O-acyltransferase [Chromobacterium phragmitis]AXE30422.1 MBOAT family protein [Chromobacterium phragmitis]AXE35795.1 MBOAT family protein [Chromobacterium phragmitis]
MSYLSIEFALAFVGFFAVYWGCRRMPSMQNLLLLLASYLFYAKLDWRFASILAAYTLAQHALSRRMTQSGRPKRWLQASLLLAVGNLALFKYFDFFRESAQAGLNALGVTALLPALDILMPVGISFYTFQSVSYFVSVYRKEIKSAPLPQFALFLAFFPTLLAGPICRANDLLEQLRRPALRQVAHLDRALGLIALALLKKLWLAGWLASAWVDPVFAAPDTFHAMEVWAAFYAYALQIYLDFSGYTDLVTALALLLGIQLPRNFDAPYLALNLRDFWRRWHISLSSWIRDYVYIPLGGNRNGFARAQVNLLAAMLLSGLWHGASLKYLVWGGMHGVGVVALNIGDKLWKRDAVSRASPWLSRLITFHYVCLAWVFFRAQSLDEAVDFLRAMFDPSGQELTLNAPGLLLLLAAWLMALPWLSRLPERCFGRLAALPWWGKPLLLSVVALLVISLAPSGIPGFIYYQF